MGLTNLLFFVWFYDHSKVLIFIDVVANPVYQGAKPIFKIHQSHDMYKNPNKPRYKTFYEILFLRQIKNGLIPANNCQ